MGKFGGGPEGGLCRLCFSRGLGADEIKISEAVYRNGPFSN
jgi:hypothetical protein